jgi:hypothetical protein
MSGKSGRLPANCSKKPGGQPRGSPPGSSGRTMTSATAPSGSSGEGISNAPPGYTTVLCRKAVSVFFICLFGDPLGISTELYCWRYSRNARAASRDSLWLSKNSIKALTSAAISGGNSRAHSSRDLLFPQQVSLLGIVGRLYTVGYIVLLGDTECNHEGDGQAWDLEPLISDPLSLWTRHSPGCRGHNAQLEVH